MIKNSLLVTMIAAFLVLGSCKKKETPQPAKPGPVTITATVPDDSNVVTFHAEATDAVKFTWDLGNGETPVGQDVTGTYLFAGNYTVTCTAQGREENTVGTKDIVVKVGDPDVYNAVNLALSGYNAETGKSEAVWTWVDAPGVFADGPRISTPDTVYFNPIDYSWWVNEGGDLNEAALDDEYSFKLNPQMEYVNDFKTAFMVNWAWAAVRGYGTPDIWDDLAYEGYEAPAASWSVEHIANINDTLSFQTDINGTMMDGAYVIHLTNNASLGMESAGYDYQILKLTADTLWVRYDNSFPSNLGDFYDPDVLASEGATPGDPDESYLKLVRKK